jgi:hypothetical protein
MASRNTSKSSWHQKIAVLKIWLEDLKRNKKGPRKHSVVVEIDED